MNEERYQEWLENPVTEYFLKYLTDSSKEESELLADMIISGGIVGELEQKRISTTCATLISISEIDFEEIDEFYKREDE